MAEIEIIKGADNNNPPDTLRQAYPKINRNFTRINDQLVGHIDSNAAHAADDITYNGSAPWANVKQAIDGIDTRIDSIVAQAGDDNTEIVDARGGYPVLGDRLNAFDAQLADIVINVKYPPAPMESAKVDGVTDDTAAIQAVINYVSGLGGGTVFIPEGACLVTGLSILSNVHLTGSGENLTTIKHIDNSTNHCLYSTSKSNIKISNLAIDGNKVNQAVNTYFGIAANSVTNLRIENVIVKNCSAHGIDARFCEDVSILNNKLFDNYNVGINFRSVYYGVINKNICHGNGMGGIYLEDFSSRYCVVSENISYNNGTDVTHQGILVQAENVQVTDNFSFSNTGVGIDLGNCSRITVKGNYVYNNGSIGIELNSTDDSVVMGNIVVANGRLNNSSGIMVIEMGYTGGSNNNIIANNRISLGGTTYQNYAIEVSSAATNTMVIGNNVLNGGNVKNIQNAGTNTLIKDNIGWKTEGHVVATFDTSSVGDKYLTIAHGLNGVPSVDKITFGITNVGDAIFNAYAPICISSDGSNIVVRVTVVTATGVPGSVGKLIANITA